MTYRIGTWIPDRPDSRDRLFAAPTRRAAMELPLMVDHRKKLAPVPVENQGTAGSCTANSVVTQIEFHHDVLGPKKRKHVDFSRRWLYTKALIAEGSFPHDVGCQIRTVMRLASKYGVPLESRWPYDERKISERPPALQKDCRINNYMRVSPDLVSIKAALAMGYIISFGFQVTSGFMSEETERTGIVRKWKRGERMLGGHAVVAVGYNEEMTDGVLSYPSLICRNSWGKSWGNSGHFYLPFDWITTPGMSDDFWLARSVLFHD